MATRTECKFSQCPTHPERSWAAHCLKGAYVLNKSTKNIPNIGT